MTNAASRRAGAHVIVFGNEKGGSGKTTTALHVAIALLKAGKRVASIDLDSRQRSFTRCIENRKAWREDADLPLELPEHFSVLRAKGERLSQIESLEFEAFAEAVETVQDDYGFLIIDTPGYDNYLMRLSHSMADTLITPMNDSYVDFDVLGRVDPVTDEIVKTSHYARMVCEARHERRIVDNADIDWVVVRNRLSTLVSRNWHNIGGSIRKLSKSLGFRTADGISERVIFREFFPMGLTAVDELDERTLGGRPTISHLAARQEIRSLIAELRLPMERRPSRVTDLDPAWDDDDEPPFRLPRAVGK